VPSRMISVSASRSSLLAPAHPGGPVKRAVKWLWCVVWLSRMTPASWYQKNINSFTSCLCGYYTTSLINFLHFLWSTASSLHICWVCQSFSITSLPSFLWPASMSYTFHFIIHAFSPNHSRPLLKHGHTTLTYIALPLYNYIIYS